MNFEASKSKSGLENAIFRYPYSWPKIRVPKTRLSAALSSSEAPLGEVEVDVGLGAQLDELQLDGVKLGGPAIKSEAVEGSPELAIVFEEQSEGLGRHFRRASKPLGLIGPLTLINCRIRVVRNSEFHTFRGFRNPDRTISPTG